MELKVESEKVLEAAKICNETRKVLMTMFPEAFKQERLLKGFEYKRGQNPFLCVTHTSEEFKERAFYLNDEYNWELNFYADSWYLIPTRKN